MIRSAFVIIFTLLLIISCNQDDANPTVNDFTYSEGGTEKSVDTGATFQVKAVLEDGQGLKEFKLNIHNNFDGHAHKKAIDWDEIYVEDITGKTFELTHEFKIPSAKSGPYHITLNALDQSGNESKTSLLYLQVDRPDAPMIQIDTPSFNDLSIAKGDTLYVDGQITDDADLAQVNVLSELDKETEEVPIFDQNYALSDTIQPIWDLQNDGKLKIQIPTDATSGTYLFHIDVTDSTGNFAVEEQFFKVIP